MRTWTWVGAFVVLVTTLVVAPPAGAADEPLVEALDVEYDAQHGVSYVVGANAAGEIDVYYGANRSWTKLAENRDIDNRYSPAEFDGIAFGGTGARFGVAVGTVVLDVNPLNGSSNVDLQPRCTSINAREFSDKPYFGDGRPQVVADTLAECLDVEYDAANDLYVLVGVSTTGEIDVYHGDNSGWTKLQENRDIDNRFAAGEFVDMALGADPYAGIVVGNRIVDVNPLNGSNNVDLQQRCAYTNARNFSGKPYFGDFTPRVLDGLTACLAVEWDGDNDRFIIVGTDAAGRIDVYHGTTDGDWTKLQENRDLDNRFSPDEFVGFAFGQGPRYTGVAIGNDDDHKVAWRTYEPRATSVNIREFSDKPWFGDGRPRAITR
ncbi:MAG: hypothetical protein AAGF02_05560 [Actinomycetota bacterium]